MINFTRKFSILSPKISRQAIKLRQDRYLSMRKLSNRAVRARDIARSKTLWSLFKYFIITSRGVIILARYDVILDHLDRASL